MKFSQFKFFIAAFVVLGTGILIAIFLPSSNILKAADPTLEDKFSQLIDSQNKLTVALNDALLQGQTSTSKPANLPMNAINAAPPMCQYDWSTWYSSGTYKASTTWNTDIVTTGTGSYFLDLNGDGLTDYLYASGGNGFMSCAYLNTGSGWNLVHKCLASLNGNTNAWTYYGDCAA